MRRRCAGVGGSRIVSVSLVSLSVSTAVFFAAKTEAVGHAWRGRVSARRVANAGLYRRWSLETISSAAGRSAARSFPSTHARAVS